MEAIANYYQNLQLPAELTLKFKWLDQIACANKGHVYIR